MADDKAKAMTKSGVLQEIATATNLKKSEVSGVLEALDALIKKQLGKKGPGVLTIPGLFKLTKKIKPATKARKGIDPFTKQERMFKAKPARTVVRARPLKALNDSLK